MKVGILGDIHGNHLALKAVLAAAKKNDVEQLLITGDIVGYYPFVKEVLELLKPWKQQVVKGNHEVMLARSLNDSAYLSKTTTKYGSSIKIAIDTLTSEEIDYLITLPSLLNLEIENISLTLCHGSPVNVDEYIYPDSDLSKLTWLNSYNNKLIITGHTHYPMLRKWKNLTILNPGSVGQPRNKIRSAHWVLFDTSKNTFKFMLEEYDINKIIDAVKLTDPDNAYLRRVLTR